MPGWEKPVRKIGLADRAREALQIEPEIGLADKSQTGLADKSRDRSCR